MSEAVRRGVVAMVLAGGRGRRMDILCHLRPKPLLPFAGTFRVIDFVLSNCVHSQIERTAILVDYLGSAMTNYAGVWCSANHMPSRHDVLMPKAGSYAGTADAVYQNLDYLRRCNADRILVLAGDHIYKMDYRGILSQHERVKADITVGVVEVSIQQAHRFGIVTTDGEGRVVEFAEKPRIPRSNLISMGIYVFNREILSRRLSEDARQPDSPHDFGYAVIPEMVRQDSVYAYRFSGYWQDIGTVESYYLANMELTRQASSFSTDGKWPIFTQQTYDLLPNVTGQGSVRNSLISPGCMIKGIVDNSVVSPGVTVEEKANDTDYYQYYRGFQHQYHWLITKYSIPLPGKGGR